jgi:uncharacterized protein (TIRG00374 family)
MRRRVIFWVGIAVSVLGVYLAIRNVNMAETWRALRHARYVFVLPVIVLQVPIFWLRALRWKVMLRGVRDIRVYPLFRATLVGFMANNVLPARVGEVVRAYAIGRTERVSKSAAFATIVLERILDGIMVLAAFWSVLIFTGARSALVSAGAGWLINGAYLLLGVSVGAIPFLVLLKLRPDWGQGLIRRLFRFFPERVRSLAEGSTERFASGLSALGDFRGLVEIIALSVALWVVLALTNYSVFLAFDATPPVWASFVVLTVASLGVILPSSPGYVGTFHFFCVLGLSIIPGLAMSAEDRLSYAILIHVAMYLPVTLAGLYYLRSDHLSLRSTEGVDNG